jgi:23S rRNA (cytidine1920-2'-O)/16S rRNA (cytidine1409-2'-O)-methyltransferase
MKKQRLDLLLVERGLVESRALAQRLVMAGQVRVDGQVALKPSDKVAEQAVLSIDQGPRYVSRGGEKLEAALLAFELPVVGRICADVGASTGGFTDCLLQHGASKVYAIDVGEGILDWKLRRHPQVVVMEGTNARYVEKLPEPVSLVTIDASFISLKVLLPVVRGWLPLSLNPSPLVGEGSLPLTPNPSPLRGEGQKERGDIIALIKPQFEAGRLEVRRGKGVIRDPAVHRQVLLEVLGYAVEDGWQVCGLIASPLLGPKGNREFLTWLQPGGVAQQDIASLVETALE